MTEKIQVTINGKGVEALKGERLIDVAQRAGDYIPRFCYHPKLSVVASCRMCLVDIEGMGKPQPACSTLCQPDMVVRTQSKKAIDAQKAIMQFLLINHPLHCPICDQAGECELQDTAMGYGEGVSEYAETKRVVADEDLGPLVATEMSLCIHCTRCVRFGKEIAGMGELGFMGRGDQSSISTYLAEGLKSEVSGNVIDLCPVGALTSKPFRFRGRSFAFKQYFGVSAHDCMGSNLSYHVSPKGYDQLSDVLRTVPLTHHALNETWLSNRDRFAYEGLYENRLLSPLLKDGDTFKAIDWEQALLILVERLKAIDPKRTKVGLSPIVTNEEGYLCHQLFNRLGVFDIDSQLVRQDVFEHRLRPANVDLQSFETFEKIVLVGSQIRTEQPLIALRLREASKHCDIVSMGSRAIDKHFEAQEILVSPTQLFSTLASYVKNSQQKTLFILGEEAWRSPQSSQILGLLDQQVLGSEYMVLPPGANTLGLLAMGLLSQDLARHPSAVEVKSEEPLAQGLDFVWLHQADPLLDMNMAVEKLKAAFVVSLSSHDTPGIREVSDLILPVSMPQESPGSYINYLGMFQTFSQATKPRGETKMGYSVYQVLQALLWEQEAEEMSTLQQSLQTAYAALTWPTDDQVVSIPKDIEGFVHMPLYHPYQLDVPLRYAKALNEAYPASSAIYCHQDDHAALSKVIPEIQVSDRVAKGGVYYQVSNQLPIRNWEL